MKIIILILVAIFVITTPNAYSQQLETFTNSKVFSEGQPLFVYGNAQPNENLIIRLFAPDGTIAKFEQVTTNDDGAFNLILLTWPESSTAFPFGTYAIETINTSQAGYSQKIDIKFTSTSELVEVPVDRQVNTLVFAPETAAVDVPFRVFVQTTSDGLLVAGDPQQLLETSHVHLPTDEVESLSDSFKTLHQGLYYVDYTPTLQGTYVFHVVTFSQGTISHGSSATNVLSQDISGISDQIIRLNSILDQTSGELDRLKSEIQGFGSTLESASENIDSSVTSISTSVTNIEEASVQLNSLFLPLVASIGVIVALQLVILARRR